MSSQQQVMDSLKLVRLDNILKGFVEEAYDHVQTSLNQAVDPTVDGRKNILLALHEAKQKLYRLDILCQWGQKAKAAVQCKRVLDSCRQDGDALVAVADQLAYLHSELLYTRTPVFDVPLSFRILGEGNVNILPNRIWKDILAQDPVGSKSLAFHPNKSLLDNDAVTERMAFIIKSKLVLEDIQEYPFNMKFDRDSSTVILISKELLYQVTLCLVPSPAIENIVRKWRKEPDEGHGEDEIMVDRVEDALIDDFYMWRWSAVSVKILPDLEVSNSHISSTTVDIVRQAVDDRIWMTSDLQILQKIRVKDILLPKSDMSNIESPLLELHKLLREISSHILLSIVVLESARNLEAGTWKGSLKVGKPEDASGIRIEMWCDLPVLTQYEYDRMKYSDYLDEKEEADVPESTHAAFEILFDSSGSLSPHVYPTLIDGDFSGVVLELCKPDASGHDNLNKILLEIASRLANSQLQAIMSSLKRQMKQHNNNLDQYSSLNYHASGSNGRKSPRLDFITCNEGILSLYINLKTGYPLYMLGSSVLEDGVAYDKAHTLVQHSSSRLAAEIKQSQVSSLSDKTTRSMHFCSLVAKHAMLVWSELVSLISMCHMLVHDPLPHLTRCDNVPGVMQNSSKYTVCYKVESSKLIRLPRGLVPRTKQQYMDHLIGYLALQTDLGNLGLQNARFGIYQANESSIITKERLTIIDDPSWSSIFGESEGKNRDLSGKKRSRSDDILSCPGLYSEISESTRQQFLRLQDSCLLKFAQESMLLQFEELMIHPTIMPTDDTRSIVFRIELPKPILISKRALVPEDKCTSVTIHVNQELTNLSIHLKDSEGLGIVLGRITSTPSSLIKFTSTGSSVVLEYDNRSKKVHDGVWEAISGLFRFFECQKLASELSRHMYHNDDHVYRISEEMQVKLTSIDVDVIYFEIQKSGGPTGEFNCQANISWGDARIDPTSWPDGQKALKSTPRLSLSEYVPKQITDKIDEELRNATDTLSTEGFSRLFSSMAHLSYICNFLNCSLLGSKMQSETPIKKGEVQVINIEARISHESKLFGVFIEFKCAQKRALVCKCLIDVLGFKDFECHPLQEPSDPSSLAWFDQAWGMWKMENGWDVQAKQNGIFVSSGSLLSLQKQLKELLFCCCGQR